MRLEIFSYNREAEKILPKLWNILEEIILSSVSEDEWNQFMDFLDSKTADIEK